jgi:hypothetical protein
MKEKEEIRPDEFLFPYLPRHEIMFSFFAPARACHDGVVSGTKKAAHRKRVMKALHPFAQGGIDG